MNDEEQLRLVARSSPVPPRVGDCVRPDRDPAQFYLDNGLFGGTDAFVLLRVATSTAPACTRGGRRLLDATHCSAALVNGSTELTCIEPSPDLVLQEGLPVCHAHLLAR